MRYENITPKFFAKNRTKLIELMEPDSIAIFNSNYSMPTNGDGCFPYKQNSNLFYLSGIEQEDTILVLCKNKRAIEEHLFIKASNEKDNIWLGEQLVKEEAQRISGVTHMHELQELEAFFAARIPGFRHVLVDINEQFNVHTGVKCKGFTMLQELKDRFPLKKYGSAAILLTQLRMVKEQQEIDLIRKACEITGEAFKIILDFVCPGVKEYEIEAEASRSILKQGATRFAYPPIFGAGINSCVLHYFHNHNTCKDGEMLTLDVGAEYANYSADISRSIPVNGKFTKRQSEVYEAVERIQQRAIDELRVGKRLDDYEKEVAQMMEQELIGLGLLKEEAIAHQSVDEPLYRKFYMHRTAHHIGLDTHDVHIKDMPLKEGMVLTCEPGIYIWEEAIGIRLEDVVLVTKKGPVVLSASIPKALHEIEQYMASTRSSREILASVE